MINQISLHKAILWEEAKGKLRAMVAVNGQTNSEDKHHIHWEEIKARVELLLENLKMMDFTNETKMHWRSC